LARFLSRPDWWQRVVLAREGLRALGDGELSFALAEFVTRPDGDELLGSLALVAEAWAGERTFTALEELYRSMERAPDFLPLHAALAETLTRQGRIEPAVDKLFMVAGAFAARGEPLRALGAYRHAARLVGMELPTARAVLDFVIARRGERAALAEGLVMAEAYRQLGQGEDALDLVRWGASGATDAAWSKRYREFLGALYRELGRWEEAATTYRELKAVDGAAEAPRLALIEVYAGLGRSEEFRREWEELLSLYRERGDTVRALSWLGGAVVAQPQDIALRAALAQALLEAERKDEAIQALDALGEMQLEAGQDQEAVVTIRRIIGLRPRNVDQYRRLLEQIGGR
jgi:tetratricopeptide (TPR) repeat protein